MRYSIDYVSKPWDKGLSKEQRLFLNDSDNEWAVDSFDCKLAIKRAKELNIAIESVMKYRDYDGTYEDVTLRYTGHESAGN